LAVAQRRNAIGLTQDKLADLVGCDRKSINRLETGAHAVTLDRLWPVAEALQVSIGELEALANLIASERKLKPKRTNERKRKPKRPRQDPPEPPE